MTKGDLHDRQVAGLRDRLSRLSQASLRINESLDLDTVLQEVVDSTWSLTGAMKRIWIGVGVAVFVFIALDVWATWTTKWQYNPF